METEETAGGIAYLIKSVTPVFGRVGAVAMALVPLRAALQLNPALGDAHAYLGFVCEQRSDAVRARAQLDEYLRVAPKDALLRADVSDALKRLSNPSRAGATPAPTR